MKKSLIIRSLFLFLLTLIIISIMLVLFLKLRNSHFISYDVTNNYLYQFNNSSFVDKLEISETGNIVLDEYFDYNNGLLEIDIKSSIFGQIISPSVSVYLNEELVDTQYFEPGAKGKRYINISNLMQNKSKKNIRLVGNQLDIESSSTNLYIFASPELKKSKYLFLSPHPDDVEIAAFGLYSTVNTTIVTITAGDRGSRFFDGIIDNDRDMYNEQAIARTIGSLTAPLYGNVPVSNIYNLGYFVGTLSLMRLHKEKDIDSTTLQTSKTDFFRNFNFNSLDGGGSNRWNYLVSDLKNIIIRHKPDYIVMPHPLLDSHLDHSMTFVAIVDALNTLDSKFSPKEFLFYTNHAKGTEIYPFGPMSSGITLPPSHYKTEEAYGFFSFKISDKLQKRKLIVLETMHDIRDVDFRMEDSRKKAIEKTIKKVKVFLRDFPNSGTDYYRRSPRSNEIFLVAKPSDLNIIYNQFIVNLSMNHF